MDVRKATTILPAFQIALCMACSVILAGLTQIQWTIEHHAVDELWFRWPVVALLVFALFSGVALLQRRLFTSAFSTSRLNTLFVIAALAPVVTLLESVLTRYFVLSILVFVTVALLTPWGVDDFRKKCLLLTAYSLGGAWILARLAVPIEAVALELKSIPYNNEYAMFHTSADGIDYTSYERQRVLSSERPVVVRFSLAGRPPELGVRFGGRAHPVTIRGVSYVTNFLFWHLPLHSVIKDEMHSYLTSPNPSVTKIAQSNEGVDVSPQAYPHPAWVILPMQRIEPLAQEAIWRVKLVVWLAGLPCCMLILWTPGLRRRAETALAWLFKWDVISCLVESLPQRQGFVRSNWTVLLYSALVLVALVWIRSWYNLSFPALYVEDGGNHFTRFFAENGSFDKIFLQPNGYLAVITYGFAWLVGNSAAVWQPWYYLAFAMVAAVIAIMSFTFSGLINNKAVMFVAPSVLGLVALNHFYYWSTLTYQIFTLVLLLLTLLLYPPPRNTHRYVFRMSLVTLCVWAGPYSVLAVPVGALLWLLGYYRANRGIYLWAMVNALIYYSTAIGSNTELGEALFDPQRYIQFVTTIFEKVYFLGLFSLSPGIVVTWTVLVATILLTLRRDKTYVILSSVLFSITLINLFIYFASTRYAIDRLQPNHVLISLYFYVMWILISLDRLLERVPDWSIYQGAAVIALAALIFVDNYRQPEKWQRERMEDLPEFLSVVDYYSTHHAADLRNKNEYLILLTKSSSGSYKTGPRARIGSSAWAAKRVGRTDNLDTYGARFVAQ